MKKKTTKKLLLAKETLQKLESKEYKQILGADSEPSWCHFCVPSESCTCTWIC